MKHKFGKNTFKIVFKIALIFFYIYLNKTSNLHSQTLFEKVTTIDEGYEKLINDSFRSIESEKLFYYFILVSEELDRSDESYLWFNKLKKDIETEVIKEFGATNIYDFTDSVKKRFAENLLIYLHNSSAFQKYNFDSNKISEIVSYGRYNCVSSSILYAIFLKIYGIDCYAIETSDHVFIEIPFKEDKIDVETTNRYGFNPGSKKEVLDEFGKVTGFNYVSPKDYKNRNKIELKKLFFLLTHNLANGYFKSANYIKSANLGYTIFKGRNDNKGREEFDVYYNNLLVDLSSKKDYITAISLIDRYFDILGFSELFIKMRFDIMNNYIVEWSDYNKFDEVKSYLLSENNRFDKLKNNKRFIDTYFQVVYKMVILYNKNGEYEKSLALLKLFNQDFKSNETPKLFTNCLIDYFNTFYQNKEYQKFQEIVASLKLEYKEFLGEITKQERVFSINFVNDIITKGEIEKALSEIKKLKISFPRDSDLLTLQKSCYVKYTISFYEKRDIDSTIKFSLEALSIFPQDSTIINNFKAFLQNFIYESIEKSDFSRARTLVNRAIDLFGKETYYMQADALLRSKNY